MAIQQITPADAKAFLDQHKEAIYIDVRTVEEFAQGHPPGAINIPIYVRQNGRMIPNSDELGQVVEALIPKEVPLVVGCQAGARSQTACDFMEQLGYTELYNVVGGFGNWVGSKLPVSTAPAPEATYEALLAKVQSMQG